MRGVARLISSASTTFAKIGPGWKTNRPGAGRARDAGDVGGQQVGGALHPAERAAERARQRAGQRRLADAGTSSSSRCPPARTRDQGLLDGLGLADDDTGDATEEGAISAGERAWCVLGDHARSIAERPLLDSEVVDFSPRITFGPHPQRRGPDRLQSPSAERPRRHQRRPAPA